MAKMREASFWNDIIAKSMTVYANVIFIILWAGFLVALLGNRGWLDDVWNWTQALPWASRLLVWVLFLPVLVGLWIWQSSWPMLGRLLGFSGIFAWTLLAVYSVFKNFR
jgi:hypothetical protein